MAGGSDLSLWLERNGFDSDPEGTKGSYLISPLMEGARLGFDEICETLLHLGVNSRRRDKREKHDKSSLCLVDADGSTSLRLAAGKGCLNVVNYLVENSPLYIIQRSNQRQSTALDFAIEERHLNISKLLILFGATNVYSMNADGSCHEGHINMSLVSKACERKLHYQSYATEFFAWGQECLQNYNSFVSVILVAAQVPENQVKPLEEDISNLSSPASIPAKPRGGVLSKLGGQVGLLLLVASYTGVEFGRRLRNVREFTSCVGSILNSSSSGQNLPKKNKKSTNRSLKNSKRRMLYSLDDRADETSSDALSSTSSGKTRESLASSSSSPTPSSPLWGDILSPSDDQKRLSCWSPA